MKIGIYPGTFDPLHEGHIAFARAARISCSLDKVVFLPEPSPRNKINVAVVQTRLDYIQQYIEQDPALSAQLISQPRFDVATTLPLLIKTFPRDTITLLIGSDVAIRLIDWPDIDKLTQATSFAVGMRSDDSRQAVCRALDELRADYTIVETEHGNLSSSQFRKAIP